MFVYRFPLEGKEMTLFGILLILFMIDLFNKLANSMLDTTTRNLGPQVPTPML